MRGRKAEKALFHIVFKRPPETPSRQMKEGLELPPKIISAVRKRKPKPKRVLVHLPAGLAHLAMRISDGLAGTELLFWGEGCYGACDIPHVQARALGCDLVVSVGHSPMRHWNRLAVPTIFVEYFKGRSEDLRIPEISSGSIALVASNQFLHLLKPAKKILEARGKEVFLGKSGVMCSYDGQVTGCDFVAATSVKRKANAVMILGEGDFHSSGLAEACAPLPVYQLDPAQGELKKVEPVKRKKISFLYAKERFGILVSFKPGQEHLALAEAIKRKLESMGKKAVMIAGDAFTPSVRNFSDVQVLITVACPRMFDDDEAYGIPILSAEEVLRALSVGERKKDSFYSQKNS